MSGADKFFPDINYCNADAALKKKMEDALRDCWGGGANVIGQLGQDAIDLVDAALFAIIPIISPIRDRERDITLGDAFAVKNALVAIERGITEVKFYVACAEYFIDVSKQSLDDDGGMRHLDNSRAMTKRLKALQRNAGECVAFHSYYSATFDECMERPRKTALFPEKILKTRQPVPPLPRLPFKPPPR